MKALIVTGGTGGLGSVVVERLAREYECVLLSRPEVDLMSESSVREGVARAVERFGAPYGLVHLAGGYAGGGIAETSLETWEGMLGLNLTSSFLVMREVLARMRRDAPGRIIAISSAATRTKSGSVAYTIAKSGLNALIELTAKELEKTPITANALLPATLDTAASRASMPNAKRVPLGDVAETIAYLLSDAGASVNGALLPMG
ncbi:MAG TPA: SDR family NAD(P)-dependent oxidoreductase [Thermoanaerobaculia bacterium]|jgi:NAD(P)-dependent dehydrogenase (short-subunit alcohol dehydrogenase family)